MRAVVTLTLGLGLAVAGCGPRRQAETVPANLVLQGTVGQILKGQTVTGQLSLSDARLSDNSVYQAWTYVGRAGERIQVDVMSSNFDAYVIIQNAGRERLASDDDSGGGTNARVVFTLPYSGAYRVVANTYRQGAFGTYTISVR